MPGELLIGPMADLIVVRKQLDNLRFTSLFAEEDMTWSFFAEKFQKQWKFFCKRINNIPY